MVELLARRVWGRGDPLASLLWMLLIPPSWVYGFGARLRNALYSLGLARARSLPRAVVSIGNLTVGGTGKTPTALWLARELEKRGRRVAILSRGYRRKNSGPVLLGPGFVRETSAEESPWDAGDEPLMMAHLYGQIVGVGEARYQVGSELLREADFDVFILDDGFQHRKLSRDLDLVLLGEEAGGWLLPAGSFREPKSAIRRADLLLITGAREKWERYLAGVERKKIFFGGLQAKSLLGRDRNQWKEYPLSLLDRAKIVTVCGIASPKPFYRMIHGWGGEIVDAMEFPDHHFYSVKDWQMINRVARDADLILTTEKDIIKLGRFPFAREKLLALRVEMVVEGGDSLVSEVERAVEERRR